ncbi:TetR/AcrR family transcriptional regulator [Amycolatopsis sp.]|uniref:TetR/AcrR family transcriptional regulator n=1 Tax=Amycolatopsis sp. TaxID=37632 RepID=UPI002B507AB1|nr:TetR/AcrR family transcriptional regulator [Amycolatopsis sp.]HVV12148.1 TetR/AcrR family transcriptional regulator [Amycolatopsis sp.]
MARTSPNSVQPRAPRRRRIDDARRDELLSRIQEIVLSEGFARLTVDDIAARLQCSKSTLYAISSSKEYLVTSAIKHFFRDATARTEKRVAEVDDPSTRIAVYLAGVGTEMRKMSRACYEDLVTHDATREIYATNSAAAAQRVREYIREGVEAGSFRAVHAEFVGEAVALLIDGIQHGELLTRTGLSSGDAFTEVSDLVLAALTNKTPPG